MTTATAAGRAIDRVLGDPALFDALSKAPDVAARDQLLQAAGLTHVPAVEFRAEVLKRAQALGDDAQSTPERIERMRGLMAKVTADPALRQALESAETPELKRQVLEKEGYGDLSLDDLRAAAAQPASDELSDDDLAMVSGGIEQDPGGYLTSCILAGTVIGAGFGGPAGAGIGALVGLGLGVAFCFPEVSDPIASFFSGW